MPKKKRKQSLTSNQTNKFNIRHTDGVLKQNTKYRVQLFFKLKNK